MTKEEYESFYQEEMQVFDSLPSEVRELLRNVPYGFNARDFLDWWIGEGLSTAKEVVESTQERERRRVEDAIRNLGRN